MSRILIAFLALTAVLVSGCASSLRGDVYSREEARRVQWVQFGTVLDTRPVVIEGRRGPVGTGAGAIVGGVAGSEVGGGKGKTIATVLGAVAGGVAGQAIEEHATRKQGQEITVQLDEGGTIAVVQEVDQAGTFNPGDRVRLLRIGDYTRVTYWPYNQSSPYGGQGGGTRSAPYR